MGKSVESNREKPMNGTHIPGDGGKGIYVWHQVPENHPAALLCLVHGLGEHSGRYLEMADFMIQRGIVVVGYDQRGHGLSDGRRGSVGSTRVFQNDLEYILMYSRSLYPDLPLFLFGHSMGGNVVANYLIQDTSREISGAIISSAWFELSKILPDHMRFFGKVAGRLFPLFRVKNGIDASLLCSVGQFVEDYQNDPLVHDQITAGLFQDLNKQGRNAMELGATIKVPVLVTHGTEDGLTSFDASHRFVDQAGGKLLFHSWDGLKHEPHHESVRQDVFRKYADWILRHS